MKITSLTNPYIKKLYSLHQPKEKKTQGLFLVDGIDFITMAYQRGLLQTILTDQAISGFDGVEVIEVTREIIAKLSLNQSPSHLIGVCRYPLINPLSGERLVYLDGVQDPGNVGTIIRTALAFNYDGVVLSNDSASIYNDKVIASSKGAIFALNIYQSLSLSELKQKGYQIIATSLQRAIDYRSVSLINKFILVLGSEGQGVKEENLSLADVIVKIPMDHIDSLNVGVAGGILMNEYRKDGSER